MFFALFMNSGINIHIKVANFPAIPYSLSLAIWQGVYTLVWSELSIEQREISPLQMISMLAELHE